MKTLIAIIALTAALPARALDPWTKTDTAFELTFAGIVAADCAQSITRMHDHPSDVHIVENNPLLPQHPSDIQFALAGASAIVTHALIARVLPSGWRRAWQVTGIGIEASVITGNAEVKLFVGFPFGTRK
jgi:hypothetical protein